MPPAPRAAGRAKFFELGRAAAAQIDDLVAIAAGSYAPAPDPSGSEAGLLRPAPVQDACFGPASGDRAPVLPGAGARAEVLIGMGSLNSGAAWYGALALLGAYVRAYGRLPQARTEYGGVALGAWVAAQRHARQAFVLRPAHIAELEGVPGWSWRVRSVWGEALALLHEYVQEHGRVPSRSARFRGVRLGAWAEAQRKLWRTGGRGMNPARAAALEAVPGWSWAPGQGPWFEKCALLGQYVREHGCLPPRRSTRYRGACLDTWVSRQRRSHRLSASSLTPEKRAALEAIPGWSWRAADR